MGSHAPLDQSRLVWGLAISMIAGWTGVLLIEQPVVDRPAVAVVLVLVLLSICAGSMQRGNRMHRSLLIAPFAAYASAVFFLSRWYLAAREGAVFTPELALPAVAALPVFGLCFLLVVRALRS